MSRETGVISKDMYVRSIAVGTTMVVDDAVLDSTFQKRCCCTRPLLSISEIIRRIVIPKGKLMPRGQGDNIHV